MATSALIMVLNSLTLEVDFKAHCDLSTHLNVAKSFKLMQHNLNNAYGGEAEEERQGDW